MLRRVGARCRLQRSLAAGRGQHSSGEEAQQRAPLGARRWSCGRPSSPRPHLAKDPRSPTTPGITTQAACGPLGVLAPIPRPSCDPPLRSLPSARGDSGVLLSPRSCEAKRCVDALDQGDTSASAAQPAPLLLGRHCCCPSPQIGLGVTSTPSPYLACGSRWRWC